MTQNINIPQGYKDSPLGVIPQEWEVKRLGDLVKITSGESPSLFKLASSGKYPYVKVEDMNNCGKYQTHSREYSDNEKSIIVKGSIIFPKRGAVILNNKVRIADTDIQMDSNMMAITPDEKKVFGEYLYFRVVCEQLFKIADTSTIPQINNKHIIPYKLPLPPLKEQRRIAEVLGCWDEAIERQGRMVKLLTTRKRALMQRLLTPQSHHKMLKQLKNYIIEVSERKKQNIDFPVLSVTNSRGFINQSEQFDREVASADSSNYKIIRRGQFAYNPSRVNVGSLDLLKTFEVGILSPMYVVFQAVEYKLDSTYLYYLLKSDWFTAHIPMYVQGSVRDSLSFDGLRDMKFFIPSIDEQKTIAEKLSTADAQIDLARRRLDLLRTQKRALMQQLLTGKKQLKI